MKLTYRLQCIADKIKKGSFPADIGTDHAYVPIYLVKKGLCSRAIASDVRIGPLKRAERNIKLYNLQDKIELRKGSGLESIGEGEVDCAILAGMGGYLICDILENDKTKADTIDYFIIQPMQAPEVVREYLYKNNYKICEEQLVRDSGKIYEVMIAMHGIDKVDESIYYELGKNLIINKDPLLYEFINNKIKELKKIIYDISDNDSYNAQQRIKECIVKIDKYEEVLECL